MRFDNSLAERTIERSALGARNCADTVGLYAQLVVTFFARGSVQNIEFAGSRGSKQKHSTLVNGHIFRDYACAR